MFTVPGMLALYSWANVSFDKTVLHCNSLPPHILVTEVVGFGSKTIWDQLLHIVSCEDWWISKLSGKPLAGFEPEAQTIVALCKVWDVVHDASWKYLESLTDEQLNEEVEIDTDSDAMRRNVRAMYFHHLITHRYHHKGYIAALCRALGRPMPDTDLIGPDFPEDQ
jgi:uncharacterized damage-inducible protein DinB